MSPINAQNRELKAALTRSCPPRHRPSGLLGNRNWTPYSEEAGAAVGDTTLLAFATSAYSSCLKLPAVPRISRLLQTTGLADTVTIDKIRPFFDHPGSGMSAAR